MTWAVLFNPPSGDEVVPRSAAIGEDAVLRRTAGSEAKGAGRLRRAEVEASCCPLAPPPARKAAGRGSRTADGSAPVGAGIVVRVRLAAAPAGRPAGALGAAAIPPRLVSPATDGAESVLSACATPAPPANAAHTPTLSALAPNHPYGVRRRRPRTDPKLAIAAFIQRGGSSVPDLSHPARFLSNRTDSNRERTFPGRR